MPAPETVFMFSGQGSHYFHMGRALYDGNGVFREWMIRLDDITRRAAGQSVIETVYSDARGKSDPLDRTLVTHPAIFMVEYALAQCLIDAGVRPDMVLGVSLGSFAAAAVAGFIDVEDALTAVIRQALVLEDHGEPGGMTAVLGDPTLFAQDFLRSRSELAAVNFSSHFVVAARRADLAGIEASLKRLNVGCQPLPVSLPFHSQWIEKARAPFMEFMRAVRCKPGDLPFVCCAQATTLAELTGDYFWNAVRQPIRFLETAAWLEQQGPRRYIDVGPAGTLATFLKYGKPAVSTSAVHAILTPYGSDQKNLRAVLASCQN